MIEPMPRDMYKQAWFWTRKTPEQKAADARRNEIQDRAQQARRDAMAAAEKAEKDAYAAKEQERKATRAAQKANGDGDFSSELAAARAANKDIIARENFDDLNSDAAFRSMPRIGEHSDRYMQSWLDRYNSRFNKNLTLDQLYKELDDSYMSGRKDYAEAAEKDRSWWRRAGRAALGSTNVFRLHRLLGSNPDEHQADMAAANAASAMYTGNDPLERMKSINRQLGLQGYGRKFNSAADGGMKQTRLGLASGLEDNLQKAETNARRGEAAQVVNSHLLNGITFGTAGQLATGLGNKINGQGWRNMERIQQDYANDAKREFGELTGERYGKYVRRAGLGAEIAGTALSMLAGGPKAIGSKLAPMQASSGLTGFAARSGLRFLGAAGTARPIELLGKGVQEGSEYIENPVARGIAGFVGGSMETLGKYAPYTAVAGGAIGEGMGALGKAMEGTSIGSKLTGFGDWVGSPAKAKGMADSIKAAMARGEIAPEAGQASLDLLNGYLKSLSRADRIGRSALHTALKGGLNTVNYAAADTLMGPVAGGTAPHPLESLKSNAQFMFGMLPGLAWQGRDMLSPLAARFSDSAALREGRNVMDETGKPTGMTMSQLQDREFQQMNASPEARNAFLANMGFVGADASGLPDENMRALFDAQKSMEAQSNVMQTALLSLYGDMSTAGYVSADDYMKLWNEAPPEQRREALQKAYRSALMTGGALPAEAFSDENLTQGQRFDNLALALRQIDYESGTSLTKQIWNGMTGNKADIAVRAMNASPKAREAVVSYAGSVIRDAVAGGQPADALKMSPEVKTVLDQLTPDEKKQMFMPLLQDPSIGGDKLVAFMQQSGAAGLADQSLAQAGTQAVIDRLSDPQSGGDFAAGFVPAFTEMLKNGGTLSDEDRDRVVQLAQNITPDVARNIVASASDESFDALAKVLTAGDGQGGGVLDALPEENRSALVDAFTDAAKDRVQQKVLENPLKNLPAAAALWLRSKGWDSMADLAENPTMFYGMLILLLGGGAWLAHGMMPGGGDGGASGQLTPAQRLAADASVLDDGRRAGMPFA